MDAVASLQDLQTLQLLIVGEGPYREKLEQHCEHLDIGDKVRFVGQQDNPESWLNVMDLFVLPSYGDEGVSQAVMQAMASRLPVIATPVGGMRDAVEDEVTGLLVKTHDGAAIASAIRRLVDDNALRERLAEAGYHYARERFSRDLMLERMESVFMRYRRQR
jgi:glycosyltransferase involved in cell wall biosynthesis